MQALKAADAAGNTKDAQKLAQMYKAARDAETAPATLGEDIVSGFQAPFKKLAETVSANYERRQKQTTYPKNLGDFVSRSIQDVAGTAQMVGDVANLATAPLQAITRPIAGQIAQLPLQAYSPATVSIDKKGIRK